MTHHRRLGLAGVTAIVALLVACVMPTLASAQTVSLRSDTFPNVYLRLDGRGVTTFAGNGGGVVNAQFGCYAWEHFKEVPLPGGKVALESAAFPNVFLRLDGRGVTGFQGAGGGVVNAQFGHYAWEEFWPRPVASGAPHFAYESVAFPNVYLRVDGRGVTAFAGAGGGVVNAQFGHYAWEQSTRVPNCQ